MCLCLIKGQARCVGAGPPTSLMSNWDSEGMGKWQQCHHCSLAPEPRRARATQRLGWAGLRWQLQLLARPPAASVIAAGGRGGRSCCPSDATSTESPEAQDKQTCLVCKGQSFLSAEGLGIYAQWRAFGFICAFIHSFIHSFLIPSVFIQPLQVFYLKDENEQTVLDRHTFSHVGLRASDFIITFNPHSMQ